MVKENWEVEFLALKCFDIIRHNYPESPIITELRNFVKKQISQTKKEERGRCVQVFERLMNLNWSKND